MCGRFTNQITWRELVELYEIHDQPALNLRPRYNVAPSQDIPIVRPVPVEDEEDEDAPREVVMARWGLVPFWAKDLKVGYKMINAKAETVDEKPAFRNAFKRRRCLIPADGFYEWKKLDKKEKQPYRLCLPEQRAFAFAGLWEANDKLEVTSCTIITTEPNAVAAEIHDRMPVILPPEAYAGWLSQATPPEEAKALLKPYAGEMIAYPVDKAVGSPKNDGPELIEEAAKDA
ncbi:SOS response-associated peptidase [Pelagibius marinus]|uniref:SOS response-associated peptidase n=1 Tax=Pelagibius marinus TaxID=2762760 RepID=UPI0018723A4C|nr:SOS response-associated peptidase [Pelagibius marinus]